MMSKVFKSIGECRLALVDYFNHVTNEVDCFTEKQLQQAHRARDEAKAAWKNKSRDFLLKQIKETEQLNLTNLNLKNLACKYDLLINDISELFVSFCFVLPFEKEIRLILTEGFLTADQLKLFKELTEMPSAIDLDDSELDAEKGEEPEEKVAPFSKSNRAKSVG
jgi:hypothetical protein